jgi:hypothetical protein
MRTSMLCAMLALLAAPALPLLAAPASSAEKQQWGFVKSQSSLLLVYGVPESHAITLSFICEPKKKTIDIVTTVLPAKVASKRAGAIKLSNGTSSLEYAGKTSQFDEDTGIHFSAETAIEPRLFDFLDKGTSLRIEAFGARDSVPLRGIKGPLTQMRNACR